MTHILSCGHELLEDQEGNELCTQLALKGYTRENGRCIEYKTVCPDCVENLHKCGEVLYDWTEELAWIEGYSW